MTMAEMVVAVMAAMTTEVTVTATVIATAAGTAMDGLPARPQVATVNAIEPLPVPWWGAGGSKKTGAKAPVF